MLASARSGALIMQTGTAADTGTMHMAMRVPLHAGRDWALIHGYECARAPGPGT